MAEGFVGGCLCGAVRYDSQADPVIAGHCHCEDCRRSSGTGHGSNLLVPKDAVTIAGDIKLYERKADSGNVVGRAFCPECGSHLYSLNSGMPEMIFIHASCLDDPEVFKPQLVVYGSRAPSWDHIDPSLPVFTEMPEQSPAEIIDGMNN